MKVPPSSKRAVGLAGAIDQDFDQDHVAAAAAELAAMEAGFEPGLLRRGRCCRFAPLGYIFFF
jgi:hypothetical protein